MTTIPHPKGARFDRQCANPGLGYYLDRETGLYLCKHRFSDPGVGRLLNRDPFSYGGGVNLYDYCKAGPIGRLDPLGYSCWGWADDQWTGLSRWWSGRDEIGPAGERIRIGGWHSVAANVWPPDNIMTVNGTVHIRSDQDYQTYLATPWLQDHERWHLTQENSFCEGSACKFLCGVAVGWALGGGHDNSPVEIDANNHAMLPFEDPFSHDRSPFIRN